MHAKIYIQNACHAANQTFFVLHESQAKEGPELSIVGEIAT